LPVSTKKMSLINSLQSKELKSLFLCVWQN
jgi:hypothetical protein